MFSFVCFEEFCSIPVDCAGLLLHTAERRLIASCTVKRQKEFIAGRVAAKRAYTLLESQSADYSELCILNDCYGVPYLTNSHYHLSISHSDRIACAAVCDRQKIKVSIDVHDISDRDTEAILNILSTHEKETFFKKELVPDLLAACWGAKEALGKLLGVGLSVLNVAEIKSIQSMGAYLDIRYTHFPDARCFSKKTLSGSVYSLCAQTQHSRILDDLDIRPQNYAKFIHTLLHSYEGRRLYA